MIVATFPMPAGSVFGWHTHPEHQLAWAASREAGASERTLARAFLAGTGIPFGRWRTLLRLQAALPALAAGDPVSAVARRAGYDTASVFIAAFRRETGLTPAAYFRNPP